MDDHSKSDKNKKHKLDLLRDVDVKAYGGTARKFGFTVDIIRTESNDLAMRISGQDIPPATIDCVMSWYEWYLKNIFRPQEAYLDAFWDAMND